MSLGKLMTNGVSYTTQRLSHKFRNLEDHTGEEDVSGKVVVITGGNAGIGKVVALQMAKRNAIVVMACRDIEKAEKVVAEIKEVAPNASLTLVKLDLSDLESVRSCAKEIIEKFSHINILINNAGFMGASRTAERTKDGFEINMGINHLGHYLLTRLLLDHVKKGVPSRIVCVGSLAHVNASLNIDDINQDKDFRSGFMNLLPYNNSKLCNMLFARELGKRLNGTGVHTYTLCPGLVETGLFSGMHWWNRFLNEGIVMSIVGCKPEQGAETIMYCAVSPECAEETGKVYRFGKQWKDADENLNNELAEQLWEVSEKLVGLKLDSDSSISPPFQSDSPQTQVSST